MFLQFKLFSAWGRLLIVSILIIGLRTDRNFLQAQEEMVTVKPERSKALLFRTESRLLHSDVIGQDFEIHISFPVDYFRNDTSIYPVLYCTDANRNFDLVSSIVNILNFPTKGIPRILVVGIGYPITGLEDWGAWRNRDLTPTTDPEHDKSWQKTLMRMSGRDDIVVSSGGAAEFLAFIRDEVIPFVEANYRASKTDRALMGYSHGGLFTLYALFHSPNTFQRYFAGSPSLWWDNGVLFQIEQNYADGHKDLPVKLFMSVGSLEAEAMISDMKKMESQLRSRNYPNLDLQTHIFEDETHPSAYAAATSRALRVIYK
jgi:predicted alpha/beta superfamily hydrolase